MKPIELNLPQQLLAKKLHDRESVGEAISRLATEHADIHAQLLSHSEWPLGWIDIPGSKPHLKTCMDLAERTAAKFPAMMVCGIGGSALGTQAVLRALDYREEDADILFADNLDPLFFPPLGDTEVALRDYAFNVISKSGTTLETMAAFAHFRSLLHAADGPLSGQIIATTDQHKGVLRELATAKSWPTLPVPDDVGGRFSVFTPVGLFPLAFAGIDVEALLEGAREWQEAALAGPLLDNEAFQLAALHYTMHTWGNATMTVQYTYGDPLLLLGDWFRQLWAESLAKSTRLDGTPSMVCMTPVTARGTTDQHSQNQLYMEGPDDKLYGFITAKQWPEDPQVAAMHDLPAELRELGSFTFGQLLEACRQGTRDALLEAGRPVYELTLADIGERSIGAYLQLWMLATAYAGLLYDVNPFDQPGVERSKVLAKQRLTEMLAARPS
jgi:glucose-6-phosphate isomerase